MTTMNEQMTQPYCPRCKELQRKLAKAGVRIERAEAKLDQTRIAFADLSKSLFMQYGSWEDCDDAAEVERVEAAEIAHTEEERDDE